MNHGHISTLLVAYGVALVFALLAGGFIGILLSAERNRPSAVALGVGGTVVGVMSLAVTVLDRLIL
jgi:hypothetical protein